LHATSVVVPWVSGSGLLVIMVGPDPILMPQSSNHSTAHA
jgi:hypothetical protein